MGFEAAGEHEEKPEAHYMIKNQENKEGFKFLFFGGGD